MWFQLQAPAKPHVRERRLPAPFSLEPSVMGKIWNQLIWNRDFKSLFWFLIFILNHLFLSDLWFRFEITFRVILILQLFLQITLWQVISWASIVFSAVGDTFIYRPTTVRSTVYTGLFNIISSGVFTIRPLRPWPPFEKYLGHLGRGPPLVLAIVILNLHYLLQVEHLMYRLKCPFGLAIFD